MTQRRQPKGVSASERFVATATDASFRQFRVVFADGAPLFDVAVHLWPVPGYVLLVSGELVGDGEFDLDGAWQRSTAHELVTKVVRGKYPKARVEFRDARRHVA